MGNEVHLHGNDDRLHADKIRFCDKKTDFEAIHKGCESLLNKQYYTIRLLRQIARYLPQLFIFQNKHQKHAPTAGNPPV